MKTLAVPMFSYPKKDNLGIVLCKVLGFKDFYFFKLFSLLSQLLP